MISWLTTFFPTRMQALCLNFPDPDNSVGIQKIFVELTDGCSQTITDTPGKWLVIREYLDS